MVGTNTQTKPELTPDQEKLLPYTGRGFDLRVHIKCPKTGELVRKQPYRMVVDKEHGVEFIRDGRRYSESGKPLDGKEIPAPKGLLETKPWDKNGAVK